MRRPSNVDAGTSPYRGVMLEQATKTAATADALIAQLPEPVRRYLRHALPGGPDASAGVRLQMTGKIKIGLCLPFTAVQDCDGRSEKPFQQGGLTCSAKSS